MTHDQSPQEEAQAVETLWLLGCQLPATHTFVFCSLEWTAAHLSPHGRWHQRPYWACQCDTAVLSLLYFDMATLNLKVFFVVTCCELREEFPLKKGIYFDHYVSKNGFATFYCPKYWDACFYTHLWDQALMLRRPDMQALSCVGQVTQHQTHSSKSSQILVCELIYWPGSVSWYFCVMWCGFVWVTPI